MVCLSTHPEHLGQSGGRRVAGIHLCHHPVQARRLEPQVQQRSRGLPGEALTGMSRIQCPADLRDTALAVRQPQDHVTHGDARVLHHQGRRPGRAAEVVPRDPLGQLRPRGRLVPGLVQQVVHHLGLRVHLLQPAAVVLPVRPQRQPRGGQRPVRGAAARSRALLAPRRGCDVRVGRDRRRRAGRPVLAQHCVGHGRERLAAVHGPAAPVVRLLDPAGPAEGAQHGDVVLAGLALEAVHRGHRLEDAPGERGEDLRAEPAPAEPLRHAQVEQGGGVREVLQAHHADAAVLGMLDPEGAVVLILPGAAIDGLLRLRPGDARARVERPRVLGEQGDERVPVGACRVEWSEGDVHGAESRGGDVTAARCRDPMATPLLDLAAHRARKPGTRRPRSAGP